MGRLLALLAALLAGALIAWEGERLPEVTPADAPQTAFSAARAFRDVEIIAARPHPLGSAENRRVRDHLLTRLRGLGLEVEVRPATAVHARERRGDLLVEAAQVENIVAVLPGRDRSAPAVALMAHYDSVAASPGAADDASGVAAALEIVRAIQAQGIPRRDVVLLMTDGEEAGLFGARAFFERDPLARRLGLVLNMEARGNGGRVQMFETGRGNAETIALYQRVVDRPTAASLSSFIYDAMPNGTDFTLPKDAGLQGLNFAFIGKQFDYHSATSTPANLDQGSLQEMGDQVLAVAAEAAFAEALPQKRQDAVYSQLPLAGMIAYPPAFGWVLLGLAGGLMAVGALRARRSGGLALVDVGRGVAAFLFALASTVAVLSLGRWLTGAGSGYFEQARLLAQATRWETAVFLGAAGVLLLSAATASRGRRWMALLPLLTGLAAFGLERGDLFGLGAGIAGAVFGLIAFWRASSRAGAWTGVLLAGLLLALALQVAAPTTAYVLAWPLLVGAAGSALTAAGQREDRASLGLLAVLAALSVGFAAGYAHSAFLSLDLMVLQAMPVAMAALVLWPLAQPADGAPPARLVGPLLLVAALAIVAVIRFDPPWTARHPQMTSVYYHLDQDARRAWRISLTPELPGWSRAALGADNGAIAKQAHWMERRPYDAAPAPYVAEPPPEITLTRLPDGRLRLRAAAPAGVRILALQVRPNAPLRLRQIADAAVSQPLRAGGWARLWWEGEPAVLDVVLEAPAAGALDVRYVATRERWPAAARPLPPRPAEAMPFHTSESTRLTGTRRFTW